MQQENITSSCNQRHARYSNIPTNTALYQPSGMDVNSFSRATELSVNSTGRQQNQEKSVGQTVNRGGFNSNLKTGSFRKRVNSSFSVTSNKKTKKEGEENRRAHFTDSMKLVMNEYYKNHSTGPDGYKHFPKAVVSKLARELNLTKVQVNQWCRNRNKRERILLQEKVAPSFVNIPHSKPSAREASQKQFPPTSSTDSSQMDFSSAVTTESADLQYPSIVNTVSLNERADSPEDRTNPGEERIEQEHSQMKIKTEPDMPAVFVLPDFN